MAEQGIPDYYRPPSWRRFAVTGPLSVLTMIAMLLGSRFLKPSLPTPPEHNAIMAQLVEIVPPKPAGLQGGSSPVAMKPILTQHPQHKTEVAHRPRIETPPPIAASETSAVGGGPSVATMPGTPGKEDTVGVPGGTGIGNGAGLGNDASGARAIYRRRPRRPFPTTMRENTAFSRGGRHRAFQGVARRRRRGDARAADGQSAAQSDLAEHAAAVEIFPRDERRHRGHQLRNSTCGFRSRWSSGH